MRANVVEIRKEIRAKPKEFGLENALAGYVRRRWPDKTVGHVQHEFDLSESQALKVVYANASKNTLREILHHKRGGFQLFLSLISDVTGVTLEAYIEQQAAEARRERAEWQSREQHLANISARLSEPRSVGGRRDQ